jgi:hypothetical protein
VKEQRVGAEEACWAHNPKVGGSKPPPANFFFIPWMKLFYGKEGMEADADVSRSRDEAELIQGLGARCDGD